MNCNEVSALAAAYADGEVDGRRAAAIGLHVASCPSCAAACDAVRTLRARIRAEVPVYRAPAALRARVAAAAVAEYGEPVLRQPWRWLAVGALGGCVATLCAWFVATAVIDARSRNDLVAEAATAHVRATLGNHTVEVASSDQHTVKPWLSARLDYSPPVRDLAASGFALVGGRLDYLDGRHVATLVYRHRDHVVDVFVRPLATAPRSQDAGLRSMRGFNVARATGAAFEWIAVSDVNAEALSAFAAALAREE